MSFKSQINLCNNITELNALINRDAVECKIGFLGGRYFRLVGNRSAGDVSLNDIVRKLDTLFNSAGRRSAQEARDSEQLLKSIELLDNNGNALLARQNCLIKKFTAWRQSRGNRDFDRNTAMDKIREACKKIEAEDKRAAARGRGVGALAHKLEAEREKAKKEKEQKAHRAEEERKRRRDEVAARNIASAPPPSAVSEPSPLPDAAAKEEPPKDPLSVNGQISKIVDMLRISQLSFTQLIAELPRRNGRLEGDCKEFSPREKEQYILTYLKAQLMNLKLNNERDLIKIVAARKNQTRENILAVSLLVAELSNLPILETCQVLTLLCGRERISKECVSILANRVKLGCNRFDEQQRVVSDIMPGLPIKKGIAFPVSVIRIDLDSLFATRRLCCPTKKAVKLFAAVLKLAFTDLGRETLDLMKDHIMREKMPPIGMGIRMPCHHKYFWYSECLLELLPRLKNVQGLVSIQLGRDKNATIGGDNVDQIAEAYGKLLEAQPGLLIQQNQFQNVSSQAYLSGIAVLSARVLQFFSDHKSHWINHVVENMRQEIQHHVQ